jgi:formylglycine-generating enzyme required for sulfatase activity
MIRIESRRLALSVAIVASFGCEDESIAGRPPVGSEPGGEAETAVAIGEQRLEAGFAIGHRRKNVELESFHISKHPVTVGAYEACVSAGRCEAARESACIGGQPPSPKQNADPDARAKRAATCVGLKGARQYCAWVGGDLPTFDQWLLAARGPVVQRYPWGSRRATCDEHPWGAVKSGGGCPKNRGAVPAIGQHPAGASPLGVHDVLLTGAELLDTSEGAMFKACETEARPKPGTDRACLVYGLEPGAIDSVLEVRSTSGGPDTATSPYGFRCVWGGGS